MEFKNNFSKDVLSWELFYKFKSNNLHKLKKAKLYNRLICHTENFFAIAGYGDFTGGYIIIITKELVPSFALIKQSQQKELFWFKKNLINCLTNVFKKNVVEFEHGMCACVGGLDRAHTHLMVINKSITYKEIKDSINKVLIKRRAGIDSINFKGTELKNLDDINQVIQIAKKNEYKICGKQFSLENIQNININKWPIGARNHVISGGHYVYFKANTNTSFFSTYNFQTQMGREIVFEASILKDKKLIETNQKFIKKNPYSRIWRWQECIFEDNVIITIKKTVSYLKKNKISNKKFNFKVV